jgi:hypothetical protein
VPRQPALLRAFANASADPSTTSVLTECPE